MRGEGCVSFGCCSYTIDNGENGNPALYYRSLGSLLNAKLPCTVCNLLVSKGQQNALDLFLVGGSLLSFPFSLLDWRGLVDKLLHSKIC